ncbi:MAG: hypothetical protein DMG90_16145 [Acidobacteria bacterium]|nr:MAG: hypothetical protein DMG90_16145 [Acidobacteriota bacterium]
MNTAAHHQIGIEVGGLPVLVHTQDQKFCDQLAKYYAGFVSHSGVARFHFEVEQLAQAPDPGAEISVEVRDGIWSVRRADFTAECNPSAGSAKIRQSAGTHSFDSVLRIIHTLALADEGGFLLHAASALRNGRAFIFSGVSGAGKTTLARMAPSDATILTDEVSYVRRLDGKFEACGTPFAGELARAGANTSAPVDTLLFLQQGPENRIEEMNKQEALQRLLRNILFFAADPGLVSKLFETAHKFLESIPVRRLTFQPEPDVWSLIQ